MKKFSVQSMLDWLETKNVLAQRPRAEAFILTDENAVHVPLTFQILTGIGSVFAGFCLIGFCLILHIINIDDAVSSVGSGLILIALAFGLYRAVRYSETARQTFGIQLAQVLMLAGKIFFVLGFSLFAKPFLPINSFWSLIMGIFCIGIATYHLFPLPFDRFLTFFSFFIALLINSEFYSQNNLLFFLYFLFIVVSTYTLFLYPKKSHDWDPILYAMICALFICVLFVTPDTLLYFMVGNTSPIPPQAFSIILAIALIAICLYLANIYHKILTLNIILLSGCLIALGFIATPAMLYSISLVILGHFYRDKKLSIIGILLLIMFLVQFYYAIPGSLKHKSALLVTSGLVLLGARFMMKQLCWDKAQS